MPSWAWSSRKRLNVVVEELAPNAPKAPKNEQSRSSLGVLNDKSLQEVPGSVILFARAAETEVEETVIQQVLEPQQSETTHLPIPLKPLEDQLLEKKRTPDGAIILDPQPEDTLNDPLNWPSWKRDCALLSLGFYCMLGGGMTPLIAAGFNDVAKTFDVPLPRVALTTGLYMMGLGVGAVVASPTAILYGKRPLYLGASVLLFITAIWCALSPSYSSLLLARIVQGIAVSSVEALPSASVSEIYFLHERAFRLGIYTLLLLSGKNLIPLVSAAIISRMGWRWVFWIVAMVTAFCGALLFLFVHESYWDRSSKPRPSNDTLIEWNSVDMIDRLDTAKPDGHKSKVTMTEDIEQTSSPVSQSMPRQNATQTEKPSSAAGHPLSRTYTHQAHGTPDSRSTLTYTERQRLLPTKSFVQRLAPTSGRINTISWSQAAIRPFILFAYPAILWSTLIYAMSIGWLIVMSETVAAVYRSKHLYNFTAMQTGMVYISPFIGGVLGTALAGKLSDIIVRAMAQRNGGLYEPEFRLVMAVPVALATVIGLMGFGWSTEVHDAWIVPTLFFGVISFGSSLGSTTAITFAVDSYKQFAAEALVTMNFSKNILHGLVFSLFFNTWLEKKGPKDVFVAIGLIQLACCLLTIPMYVFGKRARAWTVRKDLMRRF